MTTISAPKTVKTPTAYWVGGHLVRFLRTGGQTDGRYVMFEITTPADPRIAPPPHTHENAEESFYIAEGEVEVLVGAMWQRLGPGGFASVPPRTPHTFRTVGKTPSRVIVTVTPSGLDSFFSDPDVGIPVYGEIAKELAAPPTLTPQQIEKFIAAITRYDMKMA